MRSGVSMLNYWHPQNRSQNAAWLQEWYHMGMNTHVIWFQKKKDACTFLVRCSVNTCHVIQNERAQIALQRFTCDLNRNEVRFLSKSHAVSHTTYMWTQLQASELPFCLKTSNPEKHHGSIQWKYCIVQCHSGDLINSRKLPATGTLKELREQLRAAMASLSY